MTCHVFCVLKESNEYTKEHYYWLKKQIPEIELCPLKYDWDGWWSKMNLFNPDLDGDILFFDLDTVITGNIDYYKNLNETHVLEDFYFPHKNIGSGMMYIKQADKARVWDDWIADPQGHISRHRGDQDFLKRHLWGAKRWQDSFPREIISYKKHIVKHSRFFEVGYSLDDANVVCFHGNPRPWKVREKWIPQL